ncbi:prolipoprotein diacylglyceryl transferase [Treponema primitia ZAS-2]|uniref:Phosphatidylglycerol--prolipoprotein diacylglyceryl transferase n=1 Tax=Treponema primitia (strain ATCC BAA-887 / DSM 12427 / ZAS-2) TaxID=545694 RepID=F5YPK5_TREPZ|nr:prolipoprotein diacylglyceryl transferase [Treponema primitia]AEF83613.1 prolipoprotein diacylglyceryl transferase [Treponema primitia ZAS-2]
MNLNPLAVQFPPWLTPEIIPGFPFRWYGLMYIVAFGIAFLLYRKQVRERNFPMSEDELSGIYFWGILALLLGARIFSTMVYETRDIYRRQPWLVFWPFQNGRFTGLQGMSYHGGVIGGALATIIYAAIKRWDFREIIDMHAASIPLGYTFGRLGNFINGELYGRVTTGPFGMIFPHAQLLSAKESWVREAAEKTGIAIPSQTALLNLPRYPSQLFEAFFEGLILWAIIWIWRNRKPFKGFLVSLYLGGYGIFRFFIEYFREPDSDLGYRIQFIPTTLPTAQAHPALSFSTGQIFSFCMVAIAVAWFFIARKLPGHEVIRIYPNVPKTDSPKIIPPEEREEARKNRRKMRKRLR